MRRSPELTKESLVGAAKQLFAAHGFHGASVQQIATLAGVNASMINHHFGGKEGLYRACLRGFGEGRLARLNRFLTAPRTPEEFHLRLEDLINDLLDVHLQEPEVVAILLRDVNASELWGEDVQQLLFGFTVQLAAYVGLAKNAGFLREDVEPLTVASMLYLSFAGLIQVSGHVERVSGFRLGDETVRRSTVRQAVSIIVYGILPGPGPGRAAAYPDPAS